MIKRDRRERVRTHLVQKIELMLSQVIRFERDVGSFLYSYITLSRTNQSKTVIHDPGNFLDLSFIQFSQRLIFREVQNGGCGRWRSRSVDFRAGAGRSGCTGRLGCCCAHDSEKSSENEWD